MLIDTHVHAIADDMERYPGNYSADWARGGIATGVQIDTLLNTASVERAILVQPMTVYGADNRYLLDAQRLNASRFSAVVAVDPTDAVNNVHSYVEIPGVVGVRVTNASGIGIGTRLDDPHFAHAWNSAAEAGLTVVVSIDFSHLNELGLMLDSLVKAPTVLDHCAFPPIASGGWDVLDDLFRLSDKEGVILKATNHNFNELEEPAEFLERLTRVFGAERMVWGSDFPHTHSSDYPQLVAEAISVADILSASDREGFLGLTANRLWPVMGSA